MVGRLRKKMVHPFCSMRHACTRVCMSMHDVCPCAMYVRVHVHMYAHARCMHMGVRVRVYAQASSFADEGAKELRQNASPLESARDIVCS